MKKISLLILLLLVLSVGRAQLNVDALDLPDAHPRYLTHPQGREEVLDLIGREAWAKDVFDKLKQRTDVYVNRTDTQPDWLYSRLAMYWKSHATDVYVKGGDLRPCGRGESACADRALYRYARNDDQLPPPEAGRRGTL